jgi:hypothetical protein
VTVVLTLALVVYALGAVVFARMVAGHIAWKWKSSMVARPEALDWLAGWCVGVLGGWLWPPFLLWRGLPRVRVPAIGAEREARSHEQEQRLQDAQQRIAELEREIGLSLDPPRVGAENPGAGSEFDAS